MPSRNSSIIASGLVIAVIAGGLYFFWPASPENQHVQAPQPDFRKNEDRKPDGPIVPFTPSIKAVANTPDISSPPHNQALPAIDSILRDQSLDNVSAARALGALAQDTSLSLDARSEALAHMLNLSVGNENTLLLPLLKSQNLPDSLASTILSDALNSPLAWQADACLAVMTRKTGKDLHTQASDHLVFLTGEDHGDDMNAWTLSVHQTQAKWEAADPR